MKYDVFPENKPVKKKKPFFVKGLLIYISIMLLLCFTVFFVFYRFIGAYEKSQTKYGMDSVIETFEKGDITSLMDADSAAIINNPTDLFAFIEKYNAYIAGKAISFEKSSEYTDMTPVFTVKADDTKIADVSLKSHKMDNYNFLEWEFDHLNLNKYAELVYTPVSAVVQAPRGSVISINGSPLTEANTESVTEIEWLEGIKQYAPELTKYEITNIADLVVEPDITVQYGNNQMVVSKVNNIYVATDTSTDADFVKDMNEYVTKVLKSYALKFVGLQFDINKYVLPDSGLKKTISSAITSFYPTEYISSHEFEKLNISNFIRYNENCFSCEAEYDLHLHFKNYSVGETHETGHFYMYFLKDKDTWYLSVIEYIYE